MTTKDELANIVTSNANAVRVTTVARDASIVKMRAVGASLREIANASGLTPQGVAWLLKRDENLVDIPLDGV